MMKIWLLFVIIMCMSVISGCSSSGCENNRNAIPMAGFYDYETKAALTVSGLAVSGVGAPNDSLLLDPARSAHQVYLPFRGAQTETSFRFASGGFADVVTFKYESIPYFDGEECGAMWHYHITEVEHLGLIIDSIAVTDADVTNIERERIMIFLTATESE